MPDVVDVIMQDHREVERIFGVLRAEPEKRPGMVPVLVSLLTAHARAEEAEVYTVAREEAQASDQVAHSQQEHAEAEELLEQLAAADPESPEFDEILAELEDSVTHHVEDEESDLLPVMRENLEDSRRAELADAFLASREEHLGDTPADITKEERLVQARNAEVSGASGMSKDEIREAVKED
jgi:Hemerythrin HHE cation binding domain